jgi:hypothetical protein
VEVGTPTFARKIGIIRGGSERNGFCSASEHVRDRMGESLESVRPEPDLVVDDIIVSRTNCALKTVVCLKVEIVFCAGSTLVNVGLVRMSAHRKQP